MMDNDVVKIVARGDHSQLARLLSVPQQPQYQPQKNGKSHKKKKDSEGENSVVDLDATDMNGTPLLSLAVLSGNESVVSLLLDNGANPDAKNRTTGAAAVHEAAAKDMKSLVELFILKGVYVNIKDKKAQVSQL